MVPIYCYFYYFFVYFFSTSKSNAAKAKEYKEKQLAKKNSTATLNRQKVRENHDALNQSSINTFQHVDTV